MDNISNAEREFIFFKLGTAGSFHTALINTIFKADSRNRSLLALGFPADVEVVTRFQNESGYWEDLRGRWLQATGTEAPNF
jgi:hypothetical protein